jgi:hypothetical protein
MARKEIRLLTHASYRYNEEKDREYASLQTISYTPPTLNRGQYGHQVIDMQGRPDAIRRLIDSRVLPCLVEAEITDVPNFQGQAQSFLVSATPVDVSLGQFSQFIQRLAALPSTFNRADLGEQGRFIPTSRYLVFSSYHFKTFAGVFAMPLDEPEPMDGMAGYRTLKFTSDPGLVNELGQKGLPAVLELAVESRKKGRDNTTHVIFSKYDSSVSGLWKGFLDTIFGVKSAPSDSRPSRRDKPVEPSQSAASGS